MEQYFPTEIKTATLTSELMPLKTILENPVIDKQLFNMKKKHISNYII